MSDQSKKFSPAGEAGLAVRDIAWLYILKANYSTFIARPPEKFKWGAL